MYQAEVLQMYSIIKKMLPITLLLLSGCAHHNGLHLGRPHYRGSYDISLGSSFYKNHHQPRSYRHKWWPFYPRHHDYHYQPDHKYHREKHQGRRYRDGYNHFNHKKHSPRYHEHDDRC